MNVEKLVATSLNLLGNSLSNFSLKAIEDTDAETPLEDQAGAEGEIRRGDFGLYYCAGETESGKYSWKRIYDAEDETLAAMIEKYRKEEEEAAAKAEEEKWNAIALTLSGAFTRQVGDTTAIGILAKWADGSALASGSKLYSTGAIAGQTINVTSNGTQTSLSFECSPASADVASPHSTTVIASLVYPKTIAGQNTKTASITVAYKYPLLMGTSASEEITATTFDALKASFTNAGLVSCKGTKTFTATEDNVYLWLIVPSADTQPTLSNIKTTDGFGVPMSEVTSKVTGFRMYRSDNAVIKGTHTIVVG